MLEQEWTQRPARQEQELIQRLALVRVSNRTKKVLRVPLLDLESAQPQRMVPPQLVQE